MWLNRRQRRTLRAIERGLAEQDPRLADLLSGPREARRPTVADWVAWAMFAIALLLLTTGLVLIEPSMLHGGTLILGLTPPLAVLVAAATGVERRLPPQ